MAVRNMLMMPLYNTNTDHDHQLLDVDDVHRSNHEGGHYVVVKVILWLNVGEVFSAQFFNCVWRWRTRDAVSRGVSKCFSEVGVFKVLCVVSRCRDVNEYYSLSSVVYSSDCSHADDGRTQVAQEEESHSRIPWIVFVQSQLYGDTHSDVCRW